VQEETLTARDYRRLCELIYEQAGICLNEEKRTMLEGRIRRRVKALEMPSYRAYCEYLFDEGGLAEELVPLLDVVTTNKTDFFREPRHFEFLAERALPEWMASGDPRRSYRIWSAPCSSGEEPYTMAMVLNEFAGRNPGFDYRILGTDLSTAVLEKAVRAVYSEEVIAPVPTLLKRKYFLRSRDKETAQVRVTPELRGKVDFQRLNFMDDVYEVEGRFAAIFCRNVLIYFDRTTQERILGKLLRHLMPGGYLFVGHSETLHDMCLPVKPVAPALYRRVDG